LSGVAAFEKTILPSGTLDSRRSGRTPKTKPEPSIMKIHPWIAAAGDRLSAGTLLPDTRRTATRRRDSRLPPPVVPNKRHPRHQGRGKLVVV